MRARELGISVGDLSPGPHNAITDVEGVRVGHSTSVRGEGPLVVGEGPVRTGVTVVCPREGLARDEPVFAGAHRFNGNGEMTGLEWIREAGTLATPVAITNTHSVGVVRDALVRAEIEARADEEDYWCLPVVAETYDGTLNDINGQHVTAEHVLEALASASAGPVEEGSVGGGTGMICHEFKGGIGTASRRLPEEQGGWTVGVLVQANYGRRSMLRVDGAPVGRVLDTEEIPSPVNGGEETQPAGTGSIIVILATDAPLLPTQCDRLAMRASIGLGRVGGGLDDGSGDIFFAFATGNRGIPRAGLSAPPVTVPLKMVSNEYMTPLFHAAAEATEESILNALLAAGDMTGRDSITAYGLTPESLLGALDESRRDSR
ncbi:MAG: P1 family peptidase [Rubrobacteraceae bacterium]|nr:P1 family peptidase [Rubrobacteraceae bacterium]MBA3616471.1 P1 family peptidase [Rubrobacteraceae bacterium]MDQ3252040.1 P1 family peptidase [Actinomycetota bacterium]MDQ3437831.1 P1 family peptidase [Actinomycetota bacterium]